MNRVNTWFETVSAALLHYVRMPLLILLVLFVAIVVLTAVFTVREIRNDIS